MTIFKEVECPLFFRRFKRGKLISILCDGEPDVHQLMSSSIEEREEKISKVCNNYENCKKYKLIEQNY